MVTEKTSPTDDGIAMQGSIYGNFKTLLVMFFRLASSEIRWQVSDKNAVYSIGAMMDFCYEQ